MSQLDASARAQEPTVTSILPPPKSHASVAGVKGPTGLGAYAASKGGVIAPTRVLALEIVKHGVRVNAIAPGYFRTDMNAAILDDPQMGPKS